ncbi:hypothetical protein H4W01_003702 [Sphingomonas sp. PL20]
MIIALFAAAPLAQSVEDKVLRHAEEIGATVADRTGAHRVQPQPEILQYVFGIGGVAAPSGNEPKQGCAVFPVQVLETGLRGGNVDDRHP